MKGSVSGTPETVVHQSEGGDGLRVVGVSRESANAAVVLGVSEV